MELGEPDASGRRRPVPIEGSETRLQTDMVITAIGQAPDVSFVERDQKRLAELKTTRRSTVDADPKTLQTNIPYLFAGGDSATGPALVVTAIGGGRRAARSIHQYVMNEEVKASPRELGNGLIPESDLDHVIGIVKKPRSPMEELPPDERIKSFIEVDQVLTEEQALEESRRCLSCGITCYSMDVESEAASCNQASAG